jgi:crotonobetainyl-CoA:carnitine CoA-transferase CaiB-like acyl-CoA transferase
MSGMMSAQGGDCDPVLFTIPINDIAAATVSVLGICLGLFHRERRGAGQRMWTSLLGCSAMMQSGELVRFAGRPPAVQGGRDFNGTSACDRFYQLKDGWLRLQAPDVASLRTCGLIGSDREDESALTEVLSEKLASLCVDEALHLVSGADIPCAAARLPGDLPQDPDLENLEMFTTLRMQDGTPFYTTGRYARFSRTQESATFTPPGIGEHSAEVLTQSGVDADEIRALIDAGSVRQGQPFEVVGIQNYR